MNKFVSATPFLPGEYIKDELEARNWTIEDLAEVTGISRRQVINLIQGKSGITAESAVALAGAFEGQTAETWMNLQTSYELAKARKEENDTRLRAKLYEKVPVREITKRGWIARHTETHELHKQVCNLLGTGNVDDDVSLKIAARKSGTYKIENPGQIAWYCRVRQLAEKVSAQRFSAASLNSGLDSLLKLAAHPEDTRRVPALLAEMGIRFVVVEHLKGTRIDGVALWLDGKSPAIGMSLRYDRIDNFWFTLLHEISHIRHKDESPVDVDLSEVKDEGLSAIEMRANREAAESLIDKRKFESFVKRAGPQFYADRISKFAQARGIHPGIVVGQLQKRQHLSYQQRRKFLAKFREHILESALTDGWGN